MIDLNGNECELKDKNEYKLIPTEVEGLSLVEYPKQENERIVVIGQPCQLSIEDQQRLDEIAENNTKTLEELMK